jgi:hypothetical protein
MLTFFKRIRQKLLSQNSFTKYVLYALGEILLVVIGILIALQVNDWNEQRKLAKKENVIIESLKAELQHNLAELKTDASSQEIYMEATWDVYGYIQEHPTPVDSMYTDFYRMIGFNYTFPKLSAYETLKAGNLDIIRSAKIKELVTDIYESGYTRIKEKIDTRRNAARVLFPYYQKNFRTVMREVDGERKLFGIPNDYDRLINDPEFETLIIESLRGRSNYITQFTNTIESVETCLSEIDRYLNDASKW